MNSAQDTSVLKDIRFREGYFDTDHHSYPDGALAVGSQNYFVTAQDALRPFKGCFNLSGRSGAEVMFQIAGGYGGLVTNTTPIGSVELTGGASGSVNSITVGAIEIMSGVENFDTDLATTATNVAANITAALLGYSAVAVGATVYIAKVLGRAAYNGDAVVSTTTTITTTDTNMAGGVDETTDADGSMFNFINESLWWIGTGKVYRNGLPLLDDTGAQFSASSSLKLSPQTNNTYTQTFTAGMVVPSAPTVAARDAGASFTGLLNGTYSFKIARVRSVTGGRSIASPASATIAPEEQTARITFPALDSNGQDRWAIFATRAGFGGVGVHYLVEEIDDTDLSTIDGIARSYELEFNDADLLPVTAYIDDYPPPAADFGGRLENYVLVVGAYTNAIAVSIRNFPESFAPDHLAFLPEAPTAVLPDQLGAYLYVATANSVHAVSITFAENPLAIQTLWSDIGIKNAHNWTAVEGRIFAFVSEQGAVMMDAAGYPDTTFAIPVANAMEDWDIDNVTVLHAPQLNSVLYTYNGFAYAFNYQNGKWSSPADIATFAIGTVESGVVSDRELLITVTGIDAEPDLFEFDRDPTTQDVTCIAQSPFYSPFAGRMHIDGIKAGLECADTSNVSVQLLCDYSNSIVETLTFTPPSAGAHATQRSRWFVPRKQSAAVKITQNYDHTGDAHPLYVEVFGAPEASEEL